MSTSDYCVILSILLHIGLAYFLLIKLCHRLQKKKLTAGRLLNKAIWQLIIIIGIYELLIAILSEIKGKLLESIIIAPAYFILGLWAFLIPINAIFSLLLLISKVNRKKNHHTNKGVFVKNEGAVEKDTKSD